MATATSHASDLALHFAERRPSPTYSSPGLIAQIDHRLQLLSIWGISPGSRVLEIGCGQGDCTIALADAVGEGGHVDAIDPGAEDYGAPFTLAQAQEHISKTSLGPRISFHLSVDPLAYLDNYTGPPYDYVVLSHCIYYFEHPGILPALASALSHHFNSTTLCIAEWSLRSTSPSTMPHVFAALLLTTLESKRDSPSRGNIRTVLSPAQITTILGKSGFILGREKTVETNPLLKDGYWEVRDVVVKREAEVRVLERSGVSSAELAAIEAMYGALDASLIGVEGGKDGVKCMDTWVGVFNSERAGG